MSSILDALNKLEEEKAAEAQQEAILIVRFARNIARAFSAGVQEKQVAVAHFPVEVMMRADAVVARRLGAERRLDTQPMWVENLSQAVDTGVFPIVHMNGTDSLGAQAGKVR